MSSVAAEEVAGVDAVGGVVKAAVVAVGDNDFATALEFVEITDDLAAEKRRTGLQSRLVDKNCRAFGFYALHYALNG